MSPLVQSQWTEPQGLEIKCGGDVHTSYRKLCTQLTLTAIAARATVGIQKNFNRTYLHLSLFPSSGGMVELEHQLSERAHELHVTWHILNYVHTLITGR